MFKEISMKGILLNILGSAILAFGLYNVHSFSGVTEGGVLGMTLLLQHWFRISPAVSGFIMNAACYLFGWKVLGRKFIIYSFIAGGSFSVFYAICEQFEPLWPALSDMPLAAAIIGAVFVGVGVGLSVRAGGASGGDDALAMTLSHLLKTRIQWIYLVSDLLILGLSLSYIPLNKIMYSLLTVVLSGQIVGWIQMINVKKMPK